MQACKTGVGVVTVPYPRGSLYQVIGPTANLRSPAENAAVLYPPACAGLKDKIQASEHTQHRAPGPGAQQSRTATPQPTARLTVP